MGMFDVCVTVMGTRGACVKVDCPSVNCVKGCEFDKSMHKLDFKCYKDTTITVLDTAMRCTGLKDTTAITAGTGVTRRGTQMDECRSRTTACTPPCSWASQASVLT